MYAIRTLVHANFQPTVSIVYVCVTHKCTRIHLYTHIHKLTCRQTQGLNPLFVTIDTHAYTYMHTHIHVACVHSNCDVCVCVCVCVVCSVVVCVCVCACVCVVCSVVVCVCVCACVCVCVCAVINRSRV